MVEPQIIAIDGLISSAWALAEQMCGVSLAWVMATVVVGRSHGTRGRKRISEKTAFYGMVSAEISGAWLDQSQTTVHLPFFVS